jgi:hypothetical protein
MRKRCDDCCNFIVFCAALTASVRARPFPLTPMLVCCVVLCCVVLCCVVLCCVVLCCVVLCCVVLCCVVLCCVLCVVLCVVRYGNNSVDTSARPVHVYM